MNSLIITSVVNTAKKFGQKYKESKLGALVENIYNAVSRSWHGSVIMNTLKGDAKKENILKRVVYSPFMLQ